MISCNLTILYLGHSGHSPNKQNVTDVTLANVSITQTLLAWLHSPLNEVVDQGFKLGTCEFHRQMLGTTGINGYVGQIDVRL